MRYSLFASFEILAFLPAIPAQAQEAALPLPLEVGTFCSSAPNGITMTNGVASATLEN